jgi:hypothetical protein
MEILPFNFPPPFCQLSLTWERKGYANVWKRAPEIAARAMNAGLRDRLSTREQPEVGREDFKMKWLFHFFISKHWLHRYIWALSLLPIKEAR